jgi:hypothetical protein
MTGRHRVSQATYVRRRIVVGLLVLGVIVLAVWFLFLRDGDNGGGQDTTACNQYRMELLDAYRPFRDAEARIIDLVLPLDEGEALTDRQLTELQAAVSEALGHYAAIDALRGPPEAIRADYLALRPTAREFVGLAERVSEALATGAELPSDTPGAQLQGLYGAQPPPNAIATCG